MRVAVLVLSLLLMVVILFQSCAAGAVGVINSAIGKDAAETARFSQAGEIGFVVAFLFLVGGAFAIGVPLVSFVVFLIAGVLAFGAARTTAFKAPEVWSWVSVVLAALSFWGWRDKRRMQTPILQPVAASEGFCAGCGTKFAAGAKFCAKCGAAV